MLQNNSHDMEVTKRAFKMADRPSYEELEAGIRFLEEELAKKKDLELALRESEKKYRILTENSSTGIVIHQDGILRFVNKRAGEILGYTSKELLGVEPWKLIHPEDRDMAIERASKRIKEEDVPSHYEIRGLRKNGETCWLEVRPALLEYQGRPAILVNVVDITRRKQAEEEIKRLYEEARDVADRDPLTGLFNHRRINEILENEIQRAKRKMDIFSVMMMDVDGLKLINDTYGHIIGDRLLQKVASILRNSSRSVDSIGRYGGDEFLMILPYTDGERAKTIAQRISQHIKQEGLKINEDTNISVRLSMGIATYPFDSMIPWELISWADRRMYESRRLERSAVSTTMPEVSEFLAVKTPSFRILQGLVAVIDAKDHYTKIHSDLVTNYTLSLGTEMNLSHEQMGVLQMAALLHDMGKIGVPTSILRKPGCLKREEFDIIKQHPELGATMLDGLLPHREDVMDAVMYHHERYDGKGYPGKLKGGDIPLSARIIGIADAYSAMITDRPYRKALTKDQAIKELKKNAGTQFDPDLVSNFMECLKESEP